MWMNDLWKVDGWRMKIDGLWMISEWMNDGYWINVELVMDERWMDCESSMPERWMNY
jgi:hypothetical protein